jgi:uncharacterized protein YjiS (DUF1127 family)
MSQLLDANTPNARRGDRESHSSLRDRLVRTWRNFTTRRDLAEMDDRMLKDLGISRAQAHFEANRPIWR